MRWWTPLVALGAVVLRVFCGTWRLHYIARGGLRWMGAFRAQLSWDFFSNVTPSTIGGGPVASAYIAGNSRIPLGDATAIMLFSMLMDQIWFAVAIVGVLVATLYIDVIPGSLGTVGDVTFAIYFLLFLSWVVLFGYTTFVRPSLLSRLVGRVSRLSFLHRIRSHIETFAETLHQRAMVLRTQRPLFYLKGFVLTVLTWISRYALVVVILYGFFPDVNTLLATLRTVAMMLGALVMPTPGGAGGIEGLYVVMIGPLIPTALLAPTLLLWRLMGYYIFIALGAYLTVDQVKRVWGKRTSNSAAQS